MAIKRVADRNVPPHAAGADEIFFGDFRLQSARDGL
jgi:hypothetical protein